MLLAFSKTSSGCFNSQVTTYRTQNHSIKKIFFLPCRKLLGETSISSFCTFLSFQALQNHRKIGLFSNSLKGNNDINAFIKCIFLPVWTSDVVF